MLDLLLEQIVDELVDLDTFLFCFGLQDAAQVIIEIDGHVKRRIGLVELKRPAVVGITAPGMPQMSPGMRSIEPRGADGEVNVFSRY